MDQLYYSLETAFICSCLFVDVVESNAPEINNKVRPTLSSLYSIEDTSEEDYKPEIFLGVRRRSPKKGKTRTRFASTHAVKHGWLDFRSVFISASTKENAVV